MCGISGFITSDNSIEKNVKKTLALMRTRGPDNQNYLKFFNKKKKLLASYILGLILLI